MFREIGSVQKRRTSDARRIRTPENYEAVRVSVLRSPRRSARKHAALRLSDRFVRRIMHDDLHFHPYKLATVQELSEHDFNARRNACEAIIEHVPQDAFVFYTDEGRFHLTGNFNKQDMRYWAANNPQEAFAFLHSPRITVWCAISAVRIIGPCFFEEHRYANMLEFFFFAKT